MARRPTLRRPHNEILFRLAGTASAACESKRYPTKWVSPAKLLELPPAQQIPRAKYVLPATVASSIS